MRICIYGAGAVGGHLAAKLAAAGNEVSIVARGPNLLAIQTNGVRLRHGERELHAKVKAAEDASQLGPQDFVIVTLKANALSAVSERIHHLFKSDTAVVFAQNGIPWWYAYGLSKARPAPPDLSRLDPGGLLKKAIPAQRIVGAVIYSANALIAPGVVHNYTPGRNMLTVGETDDGESQRIALLRKALEEADMHSPACGDIRQALWSKLLLNLSTSTLCLLSGGTVADVRGDPALIRVNERINAEGRAIALAHGIDPSGAPERPGGGHGSGRIGHKPSMIQDYELGRPMEIEAQLATPLAFGRAAGVATPTLDALVALAAYKAAAKGLYAV
jgi:2-dehydropantoate 2-reductase